jgi:hypothetical protein
VAVIRSRAPMTSSTPTPPKIAAHQNFLRARDRLPTFSEMERMLDQAHREGLEKASEILKKQGKVLGCRNAK